MAWHNAKHRGNYENKMPRTVMQYFYPKPWETLNMTPQATMNQPPDPPVPMSPYGSEAPAPLPEPVFQPSIAPVPAESALRCTRSRWAKRHRHQQSAAIGDRHPEPAAVRGSDSLTATDAFDRKNRLIDDPSRFSVGTLRIRSAKLSLINSERSSLKNRAAVAG